MKKSINIISSLILLLSLASCNKPSDKIKVTIGFWPQSNEKKDLAMYDVWKTNFESDYPEYEIVADPYIYSKDTIASKAKGHTLPTIFQTWFTEPEMLIKNKYIRDCTSILKELDWEDKMDTQMKDTLSKDGKIYGVPRDAYGLGLLINKRILGDNDLLPEIDGKYSIYNKDGSIAYPTTFDEIRSMAEVICENGDEAGFFMPTSNKNGGWQLTNIAWNFGATIEQQDSTGKWYASLASDEMVKALTWLKDMKADGYLLKNLNIVYDDWYSKIGSQVAMAIVGSDVVQLAKTKGEVDMNDLAFLPMPTGNNKDHYSLYGGTPYVFPSYATDEQVKGALLFLKYCGRGPVADQISKDANTLGNDTAKDKGQPILPTIKPWISEDYLAMMDELESKYVDINMNDFKDFYSAIKTSKRSEEPYYAQELYEALDDCIQKVMLNPKTVSVKNVLQEAEDTFNKNYMQKVNS